MIKAKQELSRKQDILNLQECHLALLMHRTFSAAMIQILGHFAFVKVFLNTVLIFSQSFAEDLKHIKTVLETLHKAWYLLFFLKSHFGVQKVTY